MPLDTQTEKLLEAETGLDESQLGYYGWRVVLAA